MHVLKIFDFLLFLIYLPLFSSSFFLIDGYVSEVSHNIGLMCNKNPYILLKKMDFHYKRKKMDKVPSSLSKAVDSRYHTSLIGKHYLIPVPKKACFYCKKRTTSKCPNCDKHFCNMKRTGRECFNLYHEAFSGKAKEKFADDEMNSGELDEAISNNTAALQVLDEVSHFQTPDSRDVLKIPSSPSEFVDSEHVSLYETSSSFSNLRHFLISAAKRSICFYCKKRTKNKCQNCDKYFCNFPRTGRECFNLYHGIKKFTEIEISSDYVEKDIGHSTSNISDALQESNGDDSDLEILEIEPEQSSTKIYHAPVLMKDKKSCFYCKTEEANWCCETCGKSLCIQETGKTCFRLFHSSPKQAKRPNMKNILQAFARKSH